MFDLFLAQATPDAAALPPIPDDSGYFSVLKLVLFVAAFVLFAHNAQWVDKDLRKKLLLTRSLWIWAVLLVGMLCLIVWLFVPIYWVGLGVFALLYLPTIISYCVYRNKRVSPADTVLSKAHMQRITSGRAGQTKDEASHSHDRVRLKSPDGSSPKWPTDPTEHAAYRATQDLLFDAIWRRASDVRIDLLANQPGKVIYKVDGVDQGREPLDAELAPLMFSQLKRVAGCDPEERRRPQQGEFTGSIGAGGASDRTVTVDLNTMGSTAGERILLKLFSDEAKFKVADLGFTRPQLALFEPVVQESSGVVIVSGPRGSGVTSSLYAVMRGHDAFLQNIHTLEVSKALDLENVTQHVYDSQNGTVAFGARFRSVIRTEPDVVMAGDTPDAETAAIAAHAGKQGKKVYLGLTARDCFSALGKYIQAVNDPAMAAATLRCVTSQRLARVVCTECRRAYRPDANLLRKANLPTDQNRPFYRPPNPDELEVDKQGNPMLCPICQGTGYVGRTGVFEMLIVDDALREMIAKSTPLPTIKTEARKRGMQNMQEVALHKVYEGHTSIAEVLRVTKEGSGGKPAAKRPQPA